MRLADFFSLWIVLICWCLCGPLLWIDFSATSLSWWSVANTICLFEITSCGDIYTNGSEFHALCACAMPVQGPFALLMAVACTMRYLFFSYCDEEKKHFFLAFFNMEIKKVANLLVGVYPGKNRCSRASVIFSEPMKIKIHGNRGWFWCFRYLTMNCNLGIFPFSRYVLSSHLATESSCSLNLCPHLHSSHQEN